MTTPIEFSRVLIANRGEIAERIIRTVHRLGLEAAAVYSEADRDSGHVARADVAVHIGPSPATESYLRIDRVIDAALHVGAQAIHPGYGFLSENAEFARACAEAGLVFIGPPATAIAMMGDKITAKRTVSAAGVAVVPGRAEPGLTDADLLDAAAEVGFPVLVKPSAGGGGKGMRLVREPAELAAALVSARREAAAAFGDDTLFIERFVDRPRHIEIQVLLDAHGGAVHLGERECSLQRRHQKIIEEAPSALLTDSQREAMGAAALDAARSCGYVNAGTVEFIVSADRPDQPYFMEMNTRLQVEHPVTEMVWGIDLVEQQLLVASGLPLEFAQDGLAPHGHAIEARLYAEDPTAGFLPSPGRIAAMSLPASEGQIRVDAGVSAGQVISTHYDPMIAKVIAHGADRAQALNALDQALASSRVVGIASNLGFLRRLLGQDAVRTGDLDTGLVERRLEDLASGGELTDDLILAAALGVEELRIVRNEGDPWSQPGGWRLGERAWSTWRVVVAGREVTVRLRGNGRQREASLNGADPVLVTAQVATDSVHATIDGRSVRAVVDVVDVVGNTVWLSSGGDSWSFTEVGAAADEHPTVAQGSGRLTSPMPGVVVGVDVSVGEQVTRGQPVVVVEAMKMEHTVRAPFGGIVGQLPVSVGDRVALGAVLAEIAPESDDQAQEIT